MEGNWSGWEVGLYFSLVVSRDIQRDIPKERACLSHCMCMHEIVPCKDNGWSFARNHGCVLSCFSRVQFFETPRTVALQAPLTVGFSRQEHWSGLPCPPPGDLPHPGIEPMSLMSPALVGGFFTISITLEAPEPWNITISHNYGHDHILVMLHR